MHGLHGHSNKAKETTIRLSALYYVGLQQLWRPLQEPHSRVSNPVDQAPAWLTRATGTLGKSTLLRYEPTSLSSS